MAYRLHELRVDRTKCQHQKYALIGGEFVSSNYPPMDQIVFLMLKYFILPRPIAWQQAIDMHFDVHLSIFFKQEL